MGPILEPGAMRWKQDSRTPGRQGSNTFLDIGEDRFHWQKPTSDVKRSSGSVRTSTSLCPEQRASKRSSLRR